MSTMTNFGAEELVEACAAGYVAKDHPDVAVAIKQIGWKKAESILKSKTSEFDALHKRVAGCYGAGSRR